MVHVKVSCHEEEIQEIVISGHAGYETEMMDIVCAEISAISVGTLNCIDMMCPDSCELEMASGYVHILVNKTSEKLQIILKMILIQLETVEQTNKDYIKVTKVEV